MPVLQDFVGHWQLSRRIENAMGPDGSLTGTAILQARSGGLAYHEQGALRLGATAPLAASRRYLWQALPGAIAVQFEDGRAFHQFDPAALQSDARHDCQPDLYLLRYDFSQWPGWRCSVQVRGPRKSYQMVTHYQRDP